MNGEPSGCVGRFGNVIRTQALWPTPFVDLNHVLAELVNEVHDVLGDNFCGAYIQGSFAVGDADEHSDVDFIVVTKDA